MPLCLGLIQIFQLAAIELKNGIWNDVDVDDMGKTAMTDVVITIDNDTASLVMMTNWSEGKAHDNCSDKDDDDNTAADGPSKQLDNDNKQGMAVVAVDIFLPGRCSWVAIFLLQLAAAARRPMPVNPFTIFKGSCMTP